MQTNSKVIMDEVTIAPLSIQHRRWSCLCLLFLVLIQVLFGINREVTVVQLQLDLFLRKARQVDIDLVLILVLPHIRLHQTIRMTSVKLTLRTIHVSQFRESEPLIPQVFIPNTRQHTNHSFTQICRFEQGEGGIGT